MAWRTLATAAIAGVLAAAVSPAAAWMPSRDNGTIRGVNLGGLFVIEPWMQYDIWKNNFNCSGLPSEFDCVSKLGQTTANKRFQAHWDSYITESDFAQIDGYGLNTVRIPVGYWILEDLVYPDSEHFPQGALPYLERVCKWALERNIFVILDLHGAPGAQKALDAFTGQFAESPGFYKSFQYDRAYQFLENMTRYIHTKPQFYGTVGALQLVNEPVQGSPQQKTDSMRSEFYPTAWKRIRAVEDRLNVSWANRLHIQMMNQKWGSGDPNQYLPDLYYAMYDDHHYVKWTPGVASTRAAYMKHSCFDDRGGNWPTVIGEFSLSTADEWGSEFSLTRPDAASWYRQWFNAQVNSYEKQQGWIFWTWKVDWIGGKNDWRWSYRSAVEAGAIPANLRTGLDKNVCKKQFPNGNVS